MHQTHQPAQPIFNITTYTIVYAITYFAHLLVHISPPIPAKTRKLAHNNTDRINHTTATTTTPSSQSDQNNNITYTSPADTTEPIPTPDTPPSPTSLNAEAKTFTPANTDRLPIISTTNTRSVNNKTELLQQFLAD